MDGVILHYHKSEMQCSVSYRLWPATGLGRRRCMWECTTRMNWWDNRPLGVDDFVSESGPELSFTFFPNSPDSLSLSAHSGGESWNRGSSHGAETHCHSRMARSSTCQWLWLNLTLLSHHFELWNQTKILTNNLKSISTKTVQVP